MGLTPEEKKVTRATFKKKGASNTDAIEVHFNPQTLQYTITNTLKNTGNNDRNKQHVSQSTGKLTIDLIFDTTTTGKDVRLDTIKVAQYMKPEPDTKAPPEVEFEWGVYKFTGMAESYRETIDFFSSGGVPLRASVNITMAAKDKVFEGGNAGADAGTGGFMGAPPSPELPNNNMNKNAQPGRGVTDLATKGGNALAARAIATDNNVSNLRFPGEASISLSGNISLKPPAAFASGGAGLSLGGGAGLGLNLNAGVSAGGGIGLGLGTAVGAGISGGAGLKIGGNLSAGVSASAGAFSGLRVNQKPVSAKLNLGKLTEAESTQQFGIESGSAFDISGKASIDASASMSADVGGLGEFKSRIEFKGG